MSKSQQQRKPITEKMLTKAATNLIEDIKASYDNLGTNVKLLIYLMPREPDIYESDDEKLLMIRIGNYIKSELEIFPVIKLIDDVTIRNFLAQDYYMSEMDRLAHSPYSIDALIELSGSIFHEI